MKAQKNEIAEWIAKAEGDYAVALREIRVRRNPNYDDVCFHAQQCIEKYLKAALVSKGRTPVKIHDLTALMRDCIQDFPLWASASRDVDLLSQYAVLFRYPGENATRDKAQRAVDAMRRCREEIRIGLTLPAGTCSERRRKK
jgi:HEPN domain-containing protein